MPGSNVMTPMVDDQLGRLALIEAIRANTDAVNRLARHGEATDIKLDKIITTISGMDTRLTVIERDGLKADVAALEEKVNILEGDLRERRGARNFADTLLKYGPFAIALITAVFIVLVATGRINL
jgi:hypothetical protein